MKIGARAVVLSLGLCTAAATIAIVAHPTGASAADDGRFTKDGAAILPVGYRQWVHIGTRLKPIGVNILDGKVTKTPEIFNAYVEPIAFAQFKAIGRWPEGARIVKEFSTVRVGEGCNPETLICSTPLGPGIFESGFIGLGMMVKDAKRFPDSQGHWGYFSFGHQSPPYAPTAFFNKNCAGCHVALASSSDYVISQAHIGLADSVKGPTSQTPK